MRAPRETAENEYSRARRRKSESAGDCAALHVGDRLHDDPDGFFQVGS